MLCGFVPLIMSCEIPLGGLEDRNYAIIELLL